MTRDKLYDEAIDEDGNPIHFVPTSKRDGAQGYVIRQGPSPLARTVSSEKRARARAERKRRKKHQRRHHG